MQEIFEVYFHRGNCDVDCFEGVWVDVCSEGWGRDFGERSTTEVY
jgi:hypothetical protein